MADGRFNVAFYEGLQDETSEKRKETLETIENTINGWVNSSPRFGTRNPDAERSPTPTPQNDLSTLIDGIAEEAERSLELHLLTILRMSINCPFADVRNCFKELLGKLISNRVSVPSPVYPFPSFYMSPKEMYTLEWDKPLEGILPDQDVQDSMVKTFVETGRLNNYDRILLYFPTFTLKFQNAYKELMKSQNGVHPESLRYYIGIMAASQHRCQYLVSHLKSEYLAANGDPEWLKGLQYAPDKVKKIAKINSILAHQPWSLQSEHISELCRGDATWNIEEIIHIIVLFSTFHSMCSYALCCGIVPECDSIGGYKEQQLPTHTITPSDGDEEGTPLHLNSPEQTSGNVGSGLGIYVDPEAIIHTNELIMRLRRNDSVEEEDPESQDSAVDLDRETFSEISTVESTPIITEIITPSTFVPDASPIPVTSPFETIPPANILTEDFSCYLGPEEEEIPFSDFISKIGYLTTQDFNWGTDGIELVQHHLHFGNKLDDELKEIRAMSDFKFFSFDSQLDDLPFREVIWYYVSRLYGITADDYPYNDISTFLNSKIRNFIKKVCTRPEDFTYDDWNNVGFQLNDREKCLIILISAEARKQAELTYGLRSVDLRQRN
ncbi:12881_t:CDS:2 [Acaulospora morrowiae]|uniref:12881_t:CDS:1 n=1 Tax=Acaulospora morrowiae TaxID=94023 RepID=A0A9N9CZ28_9GLOM|nr:12881_t:CDS:2 [Acaulospora morrowiae]